jgi:SecD/SecF fusion protein
VSRAAAVRAVLALIVLALSAFYVLTKPPRLGLDLRGGTQIVLETRDSPTVKAGQESTERALEVLRRRVDALGVSEPSIARSGERRIIVELPGVQDPRRAAAVLGRTAQLAFHPVLGFAGAPSPTTEKARTGSPSSASAAPSPQGPRSGSPGTAPPPSSAASPIDPPGEAGPG